MNENTKEAPVAADTQGVVVEEIQTQAKPAQPQKGQPMPQPVRPAPIPPKNVGVQRDAAEDSAKATAQAPTLSASALGVISAVEHYVNIMEPGKPMTAEVGGQRQRSLYQALRIMIDNLQPAEFRPTVKAVQEIIAANSTKGAFKDTAAGRFSESMPLSTEVRTAFFSCVQLLTVTANPATRKSLMTQFDVHKALRGGFSEAGCQRLKEYLTA